MTMDQEKGGPASPKDASKKICPRAARENAKKKTEFSSLKKAHTGLRFHFDRTKFVTQELNSVSKTEKVSRCRTEEKNIEKLKNGESSKTADSKKIEVLLDTLKISKSEVSSIREKSPLRREMPKSPVVERLTTKRDCTKCSRCSKTPREEEKREIKKPVKVAKSPNVAKKSIHAAKTVKLETSQSSKTVTSKKQCSKLVKLLEEPEDKMLKPKSILKHTEKPASGDSLKTDVSKNCERTLNADKSKSCSEDKGKSSSKTEEKSESAFWPKSGKPEIVVSISDTHDKRKAEIVNGSEHTTGPDTKACLMNGTRHDEHICDPHFGYESSHVTVELESTRMEMESVKSTSKIPRKTHDATGPKSDANVNKVPIPQPLLLEA